MKRIYSCFATLLLMNLLIIPLSQAESIDNDKTSGGTSFYGTYEYTESSEKKDEPDEYTESSEKKDKPEKLQENETEQSQKKVTARKKSEMDTTMVNSGGQGRLPATGDQTYGHYYVLAVSFLLTALGTIGVTIQRKGERR